MKHVHDHPAPGEPGLRKETYEELQKRLEESQRAMEKHFGARNALLGIMANPTPHMLSLGKIIADLNGTPAEIWEAMVRAGVMQLDMEGKL